MASFWVVASILVGVMVSTSTAYDFYVGGREGWGPNPKLSYNHWAETMRFQVNDKLVFKYNIEAGDSVLVVNQQDYDSCNGSSPIVKLKGDESTFSLTRSGLFFFISGDAGRCKQGEKVVVLVMAQRHNKPHPSPAPSPSPSSVITPVRPPTQSPSPSPFVTPPSPSPSPSVPGTTTTPSPSPSPASADELVPAQAPSDGSESAPEPTSASAVLTAASFGMASLVLVLSVFLAYCV